MADDVFKATFPNAEMTCGAWEFDPRWLLLTTALSDRLSKASGLPVDFQFQPQTWANKMHTGERNALGMRIKA